MNIFLWLMALFVFFPALELAIFVRLGNALGVLPTLLIILGTGMLGAYVARLQGLLAWRGVHEALVRGENPSLQVLDGLGILLAGIALIIPGFFSDCVGLLLLLRPVRLLFMSFLLGHVVTRPGHAGHWQRRGARPGARRAPGAGGAGAAADPIGTAQGDHVPPASEMIIDVTPKDSRREP
ncbi:FxsA family protein [Oligosphaera ethanolica]|uniref:UPF0716 family protein affecting phage T7 exclusion n=1 Tax=Oligosphaera ethanolica TaxID=760260 RepID=A0AAE4APY3_9BACT|nr:FxsA family protein [Oligosphaera ethanolica]MDQ0290503.1 UPF0716 family protein affecting phage T7 exclusion [Oligosphaera ethanolica]